MRNNFETISFFVSAYLQKFQQEKKLLLNMFAKIEVGFLFPLHEHAHSQSKKEKKIRNFNSLEFVCNNINIFQDDSYLNNKYFSIMQNDANPGCILFDFMTPTLKT